MTQQSWQSRFLPDDQFYQAPRSGAISEAKTFRTPIQKPAPRNHSCTKSLGVEVRRSEPTAELPQVENKAPAGAFGEVVGIEELVEKGRLVRPNRGAREKLFLPNSSWDNASNLTQMLLEFTCYPGLLVGNCPFTPDIFCSILVPQVKEDGSDRLAR